MSCFSHTLKLVVRQFDTVTMFEDLLKHTHALAIKVNSSTKATEKLMSLCGKQLIRDCPTRWSSTFLLIELLLEVKNSVLQELEWDSLAISEWKVLEGVLLLPFTQFTPLISGEDFTTLSSVFSPLIVDIKIHLEEVLDFNIDRDLQVWLKNAECNRFMASGQQDLITQRLIAHVHSSS